MIKKDFFEYLTDFASLIKVILWKSALSQVMQCILTFFLFHNLLRKKMIVSLLLFAALTQINLKECILYRFLANITASFTALAILMNFFKLMKFLPTSKNTLWYYSFKNITNNTSIYYKIIKKNRCSSFKDYKSLTEISIPD